MQPLELMASLIPRAKFYKRNTTDKRTGKVYEFHKIHIDGKAGEGFLARLGAARLPDWLAEKSRLLRVLLKFVDDKKGLTTKQVVALAAQVEVGIRDAGMRCSPNEAAAGGGSDEEEDDGGGYYSDGSIHADDPRFAELEEEEWEGEGGDGGSGSGSETARSPLITRAAAAAVAGAAAGAHPCRARCAVLCCAVLCCAALCWFRPFLQLLPAVAYTSGLYTSALP